MYLPVVTHVQRGFDENWVFCWVVTLYSFETDSDLNVWVPVNA